MDGLKDLSKRYPQHINNNVRGIGTFCAFDLSSPQKRDETFVKLQHHGIYELNLIHLKKIMKYIFFLNRPDEFRCSKWTLRRANSPAETLARFPAASRRHFPGHPGNGIERHPNCLTIKMNNEQLTLLTPYLVIQKQINLRKSTHLIYLGKQFRWAISLKGRTLSLGKLYGSSLDDCCLSCPSLLSNESLCIIIQSTIPIALAGI
jgi:hypothetical protein